MAAAFLASATNIDEELTPHPLRGQLPQTKFDKKGAHQERLFSSFWVLSAY
jgi:hypothetical protein